MKKTITTLSLLFIVFTLCSQNRIQKEAVQEKDQVLKEYEPNTKPKEPNQKNELKKEKHKSKVVKEESFSRATNELKLDSIGSPSECNASPIPLVLQQSDNTTITIIGKGNINNSWSETVDGYSIIENTNGIYEYALITNGNLVPSGVKAMDPNQRNQSQINYLANKPKSLHPNLSPLKASILDQIRGQFQNKSFPTSGNIKICALLIDYPNLQSIYSRNDFDSLMNGANYRNGDGSFKVYYETSSHGLLTIDVDVFGWYRAANNYTYYGNSNGSGRAADLVREAVDAAELNGVNFAQYDNDNNGTVDGILAVHAGPGAEQGSQNQYIWSHRWVLNGGTSGAVVYDGKTINDYMINPETRTSGSVQNIVGIGVIVHEFGHNLGLPDLYDTDPNNGTSQGIGEWGVMGSGGYLGGEHRPANFCAWARIENNWDTPVNLTIGSSNGSYTLQAASLNQNEIYQINTNRPNEYFLLENRQKVGLDNFLRGEGLAIWHINTSKTNAPGNGVNADENLKGVDLEEADGLNDLDNAINRGDGGDLFPGSSQNSAFDDVTNPNAKNYNNANTGLQIRNIVENGQTVSFDFGSVVTGLNPGDTMYYQRFNNAIPSGWTSTSLNGFTNDRWIWSNSAPGGQFSTNVPAINSTTAADGFLSLPADAYQTPTPTAGYRAMDARIQTNAISITPSSAVLVRFQSSLRFCCNNANELVLEVSTNGVNWTAFSARGSSTVNIATANLGGEEVEINVTSVLANQSTAYFRFRMTGASHYYWMVDDFAVVKGFDNELTLDSYKIDFSTQYTYNPDFTRIPRAIAEPIGFTAEAFNSGGNTATNVKLRAEVYDTISLNSVYNQTQNLVGNLNSQQRNSMVISTPKFNPSYNSDFIARLTLESDSVNQRPDLGTIDYNFAVTDSVFAKDNNVFSGGFGPKGYVGGGFNGDRIATMYTVGQTGGLATSVSFFVGNEGGNTNIGSVIRPQLWHWDDDSAFANAPYGNIISLLSSPSQATYTVGASDIGNWVTIQFNTPISLTGGEQYLIGWEQISGGSFTVGRDVSATSIPDVTNFIYLSSGWGWVSRVGGIRMNLGNVAPTFEDAGVYNVASPSEEYTSIAVSHHPIFTPSAWVVNNGTANLLDVRVKYDIYKDGLIFQSDSTPSVSTLVAGDSVQMFSNSSFNYSSTGEYYIEYSVLINGNDINRLNNSAISDTLVISDSIFSRNNGIPTGALGIGPGASGELGSTFELLTIDSLTGIQVYISNANGQMTGQPISANIRNFNGAPSTIIASSDTIIYTSNGASLINFTFNHLGGFLPLAADTFFVGIVERDSNISLGTTPIKYVPRTNWVDFTTNPLGRWANNEDFNFLVTYLIDPVFGSVNTNPNCTSLSSDFNISTTAACIGQSVGFTNNSTGTNNFSSYEWDVDNDGIVDYTSENPNHSFSTSGSKTIRLIVINGFCRDTTFKSLLVNNSPVVDAGMNQVICNGGTVQLGGSPTGPVGSTYLWDNASSLSSSTISNPIASPSVATLYKVTVTNTSSCSSIDSVLINVNQNPMADAGVNRSICIGSSTQIGGSPTGPIASTYAWSNSGSLNNATSANPIATPITTTTYVVTITGSNFCRSIDSMVVTVNPLPIVDAGIDQTICLGTSAVIGGAPTGPAGSTYLWDNAATLNSATLANPSASPSVTTTYTVTVTNGNNCSATDNVTITVINSPIADAGTNSAICSGGSVQLGGSPTGPVGATYAWDNGGSLSSSNVANPTANPTVTTTYTVTVTSSNSCTDVDNVTVTVNAIPNADAGVNQSICNGQSISIGGSPTGPVGASYLWDNGASLSSNTAANPIATPSVTTTYTVTVTDGTSCSSVDNITVTVTPSPNADAGLNQTICDGSSVQIGGSPTSTSPGATYLWNNATSLSNSTIANPIATPTVTTTYTVTVTNVNSCTSTDNLTITVNPLPNADAGADQSICLGVSAVIGGTPTGPAGATYAWDNAATLSSATIANPTASAVVTTTYTVTVTDANNCSSTDAITLSVNTNTIDTSLSQIGFTLSSNQANATYQWLDCGVGGPSNIPGAIMQSYTATTSGNYAVQISQNGCVDTSSCVFVSVTGIASAANEIEFEMYPNPTNGSLNLRFGTTASNRTVVIRDMQGKMISSFDANEQLNRVDTPYAEGIYFVEIQDGKQYIIRKLIINN